MAYQGISTGTTPNDNSGDSLLTGAIKINSNFRELYNALSDGLYNLNVSSVGIGTTINLINQKLDVRGNATVEGKLTLKNKFSDNQLIVLDGTTYFSTPAQPYISLRSDSVNFGSVGSARALVGDPFTGSSTDLAIRCDNNLIFSIGATEAARITNTRNVGVGTTNPTQRLQVQGNAIITGSVTATGYITASDINLKTNIKNIEKPINKLLGINGVTFDWKENNERSMGVIAQEVEEVIPELVTENDNKAVNYNGLIALLIECVKEQQKEIDDLKNKLINYSPTT
jgi:hypothetical protein